jgi:adenylate kinase
LLDGYPRTVPQAQALDRVLKDQQRALDRVINFLVSRSEVVNRLSGRRSCPQCQAVYHVEYARPKHENQCDRCSTALVQRTDDRKETVEARLSVYEAQTAPLISYYRDRGLLSDLDGSGSIDTVRQRLVGILNASGLA